MEDRTNQVRQAVVLAAGEGQRLRPFTALKPKVMIPIANKPILQYVIEALAANGVAEVLLIVGYKQENVQDYFGSGEQFGVRISYVSEKQQLGTGHALKQAERAVGERFLVLAGDNIIDSQTISSFVRAQPNTILVKQQDNASKYGVVVLRGQVAAGLVENPAEPVSNLVNTGIYMLDRRVFSFLQQEVDLPQALNEMIAQHEAPGVQETQGVWFDAVYPWDIIKLNQEAMKRVTPRVGGVIESGVNLRGDVYVGRDTVIRSGCYIVGPVVIGDNCQIGPHVCLFPASSVGNGVTIGPFSQITNSVIGENTFIGPNSLVEESVIDRGCLVGSHFIARTGDTQVAVDRELHQVKCGAFVGEDASIGDIVIVQPASMIGNSAQVSGMKVISRNIPEKSWVV
ncbi:MAG: NTP transferase domain-containing protein [Chloroflexi bacterium]|nr:NTP transferase domain-containing protein [Chloroflexota bacterium]